MYRMYSPLLAHTVIWQTYFSWDVWSWWWIAYQICILIQIKCCCCCSWMSLSLTKTVGVSVKSWLTKIICFHPSIFAVPVHVEKGCGVIQNTYIYRWRTIMSKLPYIIRRYGQAAWAHPLTLYLYVLPPQPQRMTSTLSNSLASHYLNGNTINFYRALFLLSEYFLDEFFLPSYAVFPIFRL